MAVQSAEEVLAGPAADTDPRASTLLSGSAVYLLSNALNALIPFALLPVLTRHLGPTRYGEVAMFQTAFTALVAIIGLSLQGAAGRKYFDLTHSTAELGNFIGACFQLLVGASLVLSLVVLTWGETLGAWLGIRESWLWWAILAAACTAVIQMRMTQWQIRRQAIKYGAMQVSQSLLSFGLSIVLVISLARGPQGRIEAMIAVPIGLAMLAVFQLRRDGLLGFGWRPVYVREAAAYGLPLIPHVVGLLLLGTVDRVVVNKVLGLEQAGIYMVAVQMALGLALIFDSVNSSYVPWLFERLKRDVAAEKRQIVRWTYWYFAASLAAAGLAFLLGPTAVTIVAGADYAAAGTALGWLALGQAFAGMYLMLTNYIFYSRRTGMLSIASLVSGALLVALLPVLTKTYGVAGAAMAFAAGMFVRLLLTWWLAQARHPMPWFRSDRLASGTASAQ